MAMDIENIVANTVLVKARHCECRFFASYERVCVCTAYIANRIIRLYKS